MTRISLLFVAFLGLAHIESSWGAVVIPLKAHASFDQGGNVGSIVKSGSAIVKNLDDVFYTATVIVGTPPKKFDVIFDTGSGITWFLSSKLCANFKDLCRTKNSYNTGRSLSYEDAEREFSYKYTQVARQIKGNVGKDIVTVAGLTVPEQHVIDATQVDPETFTAPISGIMGLGFAVEGGPINGYIVPILINMAQNNIIEEGIFALYLNKLGIHTQSELSLGAADPTKFTGTPLTTSVIAKDRWIFQVDKITLGKDVISTPIPASLRTGTSGINGPPTIIRTIWRALNALPNGPDSLRYVDCGSIQNLPTITFYVEGKPLSLLPRDYVITIDDSDSGMLCYCGFRELPNLTIMVLGETFFKKYYTIFNFDSREVSFAPAITNQ